MEGVFANYRDASLRPDIITIDTEAAVTGMAAYVQALESGADFVIGPLTKERVAELATADALPVPVLRSTEVHRQTRRNIKRIQHGKCSV